MKEIKEYRKDLERMKSRKELLEEQIETEIRNLEQVQKNKEDLEKIRIIVQEIAVKTEGNLIIRINNLVTQALQTVFDDDISFSVQFETKRNKTECVFSVITRGEETKDIANAHGGGLLDVLSFALRCVFWSIEKNRPLIILDEPFKFLSKDLIHKACDMLDLISKKLGLQIIMVTHIPEFEEIASKKFSVTKGKYAIVE